MRLSLRYLGASQLVLLPLVLLCPVTSYPLYPAGLPPTVDWPQLESALHHLQAALEDQIRPEVWPEWPVDPRPALPRPGEEDGEEDGAEDGSWEEEALQRAQRGDLMARPLSPFPGGHSLESMHYQEGGEGGEEGRNEALTSIAGGLQAVSREKGGFGFRFGRKRWTDQGWRDGGMEGGEGPQRRTSRSVEGGVSEEAEGRK
ncbi:uncharacterized protein LOC125019942 [Mugil cephalus]|uniref:uncharacterized protein LOC125019942 n=1 Tax=Mugil cephalus TaxID=48193 RepID=UPI001FB5CC19|nr:uncharacterized protein LOC125019942 [Mugil cephalus]